MRDRRDERRVIARLVVKTVERGRRKYANEKRKKWTRLSSLMRPGVGFFYTRIQRISRVEEGEERQRGEGDPAGYDGKERGVRTEGKFIKSYPGERQRARRRRG